MSRETIKVSGMSCRHCEKAVEDELAEMGVALAKADAGKGEVYVEFAPARASLEKIKGRIAETGYSPG